MLVFVVALTAASSVGCLGRSPAVEHFILGSGAVPDASLDSGSAVSILIGPVRLPAYLDRPQHARLRASGQVELDEFTRWLGGFEKNFLRGLELEVARQTGSARVSTHPAKAPFPFDVKVRLHIDDLVVVDGQTLRVRIRWAMVRTGSETPAELYAMDESIALASDSNEAVVAAHDAVLADLAGRIVAAIER
ncbi:MAG: ABC-type transport auxiliary lipoprotein family protein [Myxococcota bacterium]|jgi:uncharacterized lipoprotein YmbA